MFGIAALVFEWFNRDAVAIVGAVLLGFVIGMLVGFFVQEAKEWTRQAMTASVAVIASAGVLALLRYAAPDPHDVWFYPAGLVIGYGAPADADLDTALQAFVEAGRETGAIR